MFEMPAAERWRPTVPLITALIALGLFAAIFASTLATLRGPHLLDYHVVATARTAWWRVTWVWPSSAAWDAGLRAGTLLYSRRRPATQGVTTVAVWDGHSLRRALLPPPGDITPPLAAVELELAIAVLAIGVITILLAREQGPACLVLLFCLVMASGLCAVTAYTHAGAIWASLLFETCFFALLPPLTLALATRLPPSGRTPRLSWWAPAGPAIVVLALIVGGLLIPGLYTPSRDLEWLIFALTVLAAAGLWLWRAWPEREGPHWPEYRALVVGLGGAFGGFAVLAILPTMVPFTLPWPPEASGLVLLLIPLCLSWILLRHRALALRHPLRRPMMTLLLLGIALAAGLTLTVRGAGTLGVVVAVVLAGAGVPLAQRSLDRLFPERPGAYAALVAQSGERLGLAVDVTDLEPVLTMLCRSLGLVGLRVRRGDTVLAKPA